MNFSESTKDKIRTGLLTTLLGGLGVVLTAIAKNSLKPFVERVVPAIDNQDLLWLSLLLLLANLVSGSWLLFLLFGDKAERVRKKYRFEQSRGFYVHRKTGEKVCGNCLIGSGLESPLALNYIPANRNTPAAPRWQCPVHECRHHYQMRPDEVVELNKK